MTVPGRRRRGAADGRPDRDRGKVRFGEGAAGRPEAAFRIAPLTSGPGGAAPMRGASGRGQRTAPKVSPRSRFR